MTPNQEISVSYCVTDALCDLSVPKRNSNYHASKLSTLLINNFRKIDEFKILIKDKKFKIHVIKSAPRILGRIGDPEYIEKYPNLIFEIGRFLRTEYELMIEQDFSGEARNAVSRQSIFFVTDLYEKAEKLTKEDPITEPVTKTLTHLVLHGTYKDIESVINEYKKIYQETNEKLQSNPDTKNLIRTISLLVIKKNPFKSVDNAIKRYQEIYKEVKSEFKNDPFANKITRTVTLMIFEGKKYKSARESRIAYESILTNCYTVFNTPETIGVAKTAAFYVLKGKYASVEVAFSDYNKIVKQVTKVFYKHPDCKGMINTISFCIFDGHYKNVEDAKFKLISYYNECRKILKKGYELEQIIPGIVRSVFLSRQPSVKEAISRYLSLVPKVEVLLIQSNMFSGNDLYAQAKIVAMSIILKTYKNVETAVNILIKHKNDILVFIDKNPKLSYLSNELLNLLFRKVVGTLDEAAKYALNQRKV